MLAEYGAIKCLEANPINRYMSTGQQGGEEIYLYVLRPSVFFWSETSESFLAELEYSDKKDIIT